MNIDELTIGELKEIAKLAGNLGGSCSAGKNHSLPVGEDVFIRTVTTYYTGHIDAVTETDIVLSTAAWIPVTGRFSVAMAEGELEEVEPYPEGEVVTISRGGLIDCCRWKHGLPTRVR